MLTESRLEIPLLPTSHESDITDYEVIQVVPVFLAIPHIIVVGLLSYFKMVETESSESARGTERPRTEK